MKLARLRCRHERRVLSLFHDELKAQSKLYPDRKNGTAATKDRPALADTSRAATRKGDS